MTPKTACHRRKWNAALGKACLRRRISAADNWRRRSGSAHRDAYLTRRVLPSIEDRRTEEYWRRITKTPSGLGPIHHIYFTGALYTGQDPAHFSDGRELRGARQMDAGGFARLSQRDAPGGGYTGV